MLHHARSPTSPCFEQAQERTATMTKKDTGLFSSIRESLVKPRRLPWWAIAAMFIAIGAIALYEFSENASERARVTREQWSSKNLLAPRTIEDSIKLQELVPEVERAQWPKNEFEFVKFSCMQFGGALRAHSLNWLGNLYAVKGVSDDAEQAYRQALVMYEKNLGSDHEYAAIVRDNLDRLLAPPK